MCNFLDFMDSPSYSLKNGLYLGSVQRDAFPEKLIFQHMLNLVSAKKYYCLNSHSQKYFIDRIIQQKSKSLPEYFFALDSIQNNGMKKRPIE